MLTVMRAMSNASAKIVATFFMVLILILIGILFVPSVYNGVNDFSNMLANLDIVRNPDFGEQGVAVTRTFINEQTIFGIVMTLIARMFVEVIWFGAGALWRMVNPPEPQAGQQGGQSGYYN